MLLLLLACSDYQVHGKPDDPDAEPGDDCAEELPGAYAVPVDGGCAFDPPDGGFHPVVEWQWATSALAPGYEDVMVTPVVGDVTGDGVPDVVFTGYAANQYGSAGALFLLSGTGAEQAAFTSVGGYTPVGSAGVAIGDLEGDGAVEIVTLSTDGRVLVLHADGSLVWASEPSTAFTVYGYPALADLDADGLAEVIVGRGIWAHDGTPVGLGAYGQGGPYAIAAVADLDADGQQEVVVGNAAYRKDGSALWANPSACDGWTAVADLDGDGLGELASVCGGGLYRLDGDGTITWGPQPVPGGGGGPPTIADFDGDGRPDIGVAGLAGYAVWTADGVKLWEQATTDASSAQTGSSVFDFEGDGAWEVVYADELVLRVYDGATGALKLEEPGHSSWTLFEYPLVVDVDADGEAEIVLASNDSINGGWQGITVIGDADGTWAPTTPVWNQHAYSITSVNDDLTLPASPVPNWEVGHNSFRAGGLRDRTGNPAPNLRPRVASLCWDCDGEGARVVVQVENGGASDVRADVAVGLWARAGSSEALLELQTLSGGVRSGEGSAALVFVVPPDRLGGVTELVARVDGDGAVPECDEADNDDARPVETCE